MLLAFLLGLEGSVGRAILARSLFERSVEDTVLAE